MRSVRTLLTAMSVFGAALLVPSLAAAAPTSAWQVQSVPSVNPSDTTAVPLSAAEGVSCPTLTFCFTVGYFVGQDHLTHPLAEKWDGTAWSLVPAAAPDASVNSSPGLSSVSCLSASFCEAIGASVDSGGPAFAEQWDGAAWHLQVLASDHQGEVEGLACATVRFCIAYGINGSGRELTWRWNGASWTQAAPAALRGIWLNAIACPTARSCFAVARRVKSNGPGGATRIEHWNGSAWSTVSVKLPSGAGLGGISCPRPGHCTATGSIGDVERNPKMLVVDLSGKAGWHYEIPSFPSGEVDTSTPVGSLHVDGVTLGSVSCSTVRVCTALAVFDPAVDGEYDGYYSVATRGATGGFHLAKVALPEVTKDISCSVGTCTAVGFSPVPPNDKDCTCVAAGDSAAIFRGTGNDLGDSHPAPPPPDNAGTLTSVSCVATGFCAATGTSDPAVYIRSDGTWQQATGSGTNQLNGVSCTSAAFCMAIGNGSAQQWNGSDWTALSVPTPDGAGTDHLDSISCSSPTSCVAVGTTGGPKGAFSELWNGVGWSVLHTPLPADGSGAAELRSVSCPAVSRCYAVGSYFAPYKNLPTSRPLIESWDGAAWTVMSPAPYSASDYLALTDVTCSTASSCMAILVGRTQNWLDRWDGTQWTTVTTAKPDPGGFPANLVGVSCTSSTACTMVGSDYLGDDVIETWDGSAWSFVTAATTAPPSTTLNAVSCTSTTTCTAVGTDLLAEARD